MNNLHLKELLKYLFYNKINFEQYSSLKDHIKKSEDDYVISSLESLWDDQSRVNAMETGLKFDILSDINNQIKENETIYRPRINWWKYAAIIAIPLLVISTIYFTNSTKESNLFVAMTEEGQKSQVLLPDGTHVWLNAGSRITYSSDFSKSNRRVNITGEAFFDVAKDNTHQFIVETDYINVVVYGTAFNISAYPKDSDIKVSLLNGKVLLENCRTNKKLVEMYPGQQVAVSKRWLDFSKYDCNVENESLWTKNMMRFENTSAEDIFEKLEHWYGLNIHVENMDTTIKYGFTIKSESIREMLELINKITPITYRIDGEEVYIKYK